MIQVVFILFGIGIGVFMSPISFIPGYVTGVLLGYLSVILYYIFAKMGG